MNYQLAIIGGGPAGYTAAERAAAAGLSVVLFEKEQLGGTCLNWGCIPTKTLLHAAKLYDYADTADKYGISFSDARFDLKKIVLRKNKIVRKLTAGIRARMKAKVINVVNAEARIVAHEENLFTIEAGGERFVAQRLLLATGSETVIPYLHGLDQIEYWTSKEALDTTELPESLLIVGGGVIGMEFASFFNSMGSNVSVVEMLPDILGGMEAELAVALREEYTRKGVHFYVSSKLLSVEEGCATIECGGIQQKLPFTHLLMAAGRRPTLANCGAEILNLAYEGHNLQVNDQMQSSLPNLYLCGDLTGRSMLAHSAERQAVVAVHHMIGVTDAMQYDAIPSVVYTSPEVASVGATERELQERGVAYGVKKLPMAYAGRFVVENEGANGFCKILLDTEQRILGVHIIGSPASEFIVAAGMAIQHKLSAEEWERSIFPHPTVSEILKETLFGDPQ